MSDLFKVGLPATNDVHVALNDAVNEESPEERLVKLLLDHGASPVANECKTLVDVTRRRSTSLLKHILDHPLAPEAIDYTFSQCFTAENFPSWFSKSGKRTIRMLLKKNTQRSSAVTQMLLQVMRGYTRDTAQLADEFFDLLVSHDPDVNYNQGEALQIAASQANVDWTNKLLECHPSTESLSYAFQHIFDTHLDQENALLLFGMFSEYRDGETRIDVMAQPHGMKPVLARALSQYPRSLKILQTLLDAGFYHDQAIWSRLHRDIEDSEEMTLLTWAIGQPQKKISSSLIQELLERGGKSLHAH